MDVTPDVRDGLLDRADDLAALINRALANAQDYTLELAKDLALMREEVGHGNPAMTDTLAIVCTDAYLAAWELTNAQEALWELKRPRLIDVRASAALWDETRRELVEASRGGSVG